MNKFNAGLAPQVIAVRINGFSDRKLARAVKKLCKHFNVDNSIPSLLAIGEYYGYTMGVIDGYVYMIEEECDLDRASYYQPEIWRLTLETEPDTQVVQHI